MVELEKVVAGLEFCGEANKSVDACLMMCPYYGERDGDKVCMDFLMEDALEVINRLKRQLKYARAERDAERAKMARLIGEAEARWVSEGGDVNER